MSEHQENPSEHQENPTQQTSTDQGFRRQFVVVDLVGDDPSAVLEEIRQAFSAPAFCVITNEDVEKHADVEWHAAADTEAQERFETLVAERLEHKEGGEGEAVGDETQEQPPAPTRDSVVAGLQKEAQEITAAADLIILVINVVNSEEMVLSALKSAALPSLFASIQVQDNDPDTPLSFPVANLWQSALSLDPSAYSDCDYLELSCTPSDGISADEVVGKLKAEVLRVIEDLAAFRAWLSDTPTVAIPEAPSKEETNRLLNYYQASLYGVPSCAASVPLVLNAVIESVATVESPVPRGDPVQMTHDRSRNSLSRAMMKLSASRASSPTSQAMRAMTPFSAGRPASPSSLESPEPEEPPMIALPSADSLAPSNVMGGRTWPDLGSEAWNMPNAADSSLLRTARLSVGLYVDLPLLRLPVLREPMKFLDLALGDGYMDEKTREHVAQLRQRHGRNAFSDNDGPDQVLRLVAHEPRKVGVAEASRSVLARVPTGVVFGEKGLPLTATWSDEERHANLSELLTFTSFAPDAILRTRGLRNIEEALFETDLNRRAEVLRAARKPMTLREKLEVQRWNFSTWKYHESLTSHSFGQTLLNLLVEEPETIKSYDPLSDTLTLALYNPTPRTRLAKRQDDFKALMSTRPHFRTWRRERSKEAQDMTVEEVEEGEEDETAATPAVGKEERKQTGASPAAPPAVVFDVQEKDLMIPKRNLHTLLPSDHAVVHIHEWLGDSYSSLLVHKDGHSFGLAPGDLGTAAPPAQTAAPDHMEEQDKEANKEDGSGDEPPTAEDKDTGSDTAGSAQEEEDTQEGRNSGSSSSTAPWWKFIAQFAGDGGEAHQPISPPASLVITASTAPAGKKDGKGFVFAQYSIDDILGLTLDVDSNGGIWQRHRNIPTVVPACDVGPAMPATLPEQSGTFSNATWPEEVVELRRGIVGSQGTVVRCFPSGVRQVLFASGTVKWWVPHCAGHAVTRRVRVEEEVAREVDLTEEELREMQEKRAEEGADVEEEAELPTTKTITELVSKEVSEQGQGVWYISHADGRNTATAEFPGGDVVEVQLPDTPVYCTTDPGEGCPVTVRYDTCPVPASLLLPKGHPRLRGVGAGARYGEQLSTTEKWLWSGIVPAEKENLPEIEDRERYLRSKRYRAYEEAYHKWQVEKALAAGGMWSGAAGDPALLPPSKQLFDKGSAATSARGVSSRSIHEVRSSRDVHQEKWRRGELHATPKVWRPVWSGVQEEATEEVKEEEATGVVSHDSTPFTVRVSVVEATPGPTEEEGNDQDKGAHQAQPTDRSEEEQWFELVEYPAHPPGEPLPGDGFPFSPCRVAKVSYADGTTVVVHGDGTVITGLPPRRVRKQRDPGMEGDTTFLQGARFVVAKAHTATVEVDAEAQYESSLHSTGGRVATTKSGMRTRFLVTAPDGCTVAGDYNNDITAEYNGRLRLHRSDGVVVLARDGGDVEFRPASAKVTAGVVGAGVGDVAAEDSEEEGEDAPQTHPDDDTGRSTPLSARSEEEAQEGVYLFSLAAGAMEMTDTEENRYSVALQGRGAAPPDIDIDLAGTVENAAEAAVLPRVANPKPPRLFRVPRPTAVHPFATTPHEVTNETGELDAVKSQQVQLFRSVFECLYEAEEIISPQRFQQLKARQLKEARRAAQEAEEAAPEGHFAPISRSTAILGGKVAVSMPAAVDVDDALAMTGVTGMDASLSQSLQWAPPAHIHVITSQLALLPFPDALHSASVTSAPADLPVWQQLGIPAGRVGLACVKGRIEVRSSGRGWILPKVGIAKGVRVDWKDVEEAYGGVLMHETRAHEERKRKEAEGGSNPRRVTFGGKKGRKTSGQHSKGMEDESFSEGGVVTLQRRSQRVCLLPETIAGEPAPLETPVRLVAWRQILEKPQMSEEERNILAAAEAEWKTWQQHVSSELNRFTVFDPRTEEQLTREAALSRQARRLRKAAKRKARAKQRRRMEEANEKNTAFFPDRESEAGEDAPPPHPTDPDLRRLQLGDVDRAAFADDAQRTRRSETNQAAARALVSGRSGSKQANLGVKLAVGGPPIPQQKLTPSERKAARERAMKLLRSVSSEPEEEPVTPLEIEDYESKDDMSPSGLGDTSPSAYIGSAEGFDNDAPTMAGTGLAAVRGHRNRTKEGPSRGALRFTPPSLRFGSVPVGAECVLPLSITNTSEHTVVVSPLFEEEQSVKANLVIPDVEGSLEIQPGESDSLKVKIVTRSEGFVTKPLRMDTSCGMISVPIAAKVVLQAEWKGSTTGRGVQVIQR